MPIYKNGVGFLVFATLVNSVFGQTAAPEQGIVPISENIQNIFQVMYQNESVQWALEQIELREPSALEEQYRMTEIPAPPFKEDVRAAYFLEQLKIRGLPDSYIDSEGNVIGVRAGESPGAEPPLLIAAHLDTVFPEGTDTTVRIRDGRYYAPGIGDDTRGLAAILTIVDVLNDSGIKTVRDIIFAGNVGEEGRGDLRGIKQIFKDHPNIGAFLSIDGVRLNRITTGGTGSRRFEFQFNGPGGHSFGAFGIASAIHAMGRAIAKISEIRTPRFPKTTFTVGTVEGGTSVNSIAANASFAIDMRSNDSEQLAALERKAKAVALEAVSEENARWPDGNITVEFVLIGDRPAGGTDASEPLVQVAAMAIGATGLKLRGLNTSSTDSNIPMSLGIPAITIAGGGNGGGAHSPGEWFVPTESHKGPQTSLLIALGMAGLVNETLPLLQLR